MTAPSNANTSGLSETWARLSKTFSDRFYEGYEPEIEAMSAAVVTAASAQARIDEERALFKSLRVRKNFYKENMLAAEDRATAAEARADRLAKALEAVISYAPDIRPARIARTALQQETQP